MGFFGQYGRLLLVLIKLKSWRFLFMLIVIAALFSNIYLYDIVDSWMQQRGEKNLVQVGPAEFGDRNIIVGFVPEKLRELNKLKEMIERMTGFDFSSSIEGCDSEEICNEMYFRNLLGRRSGMLSHFVHFGKYRGGASHLICQMSIGSEMHCPFMAYLVRTSQTFFNGTVHEFHSTSVFRLMSKIELFDEIVGGEMTICKKDANFPVVFPKTIMAQVICVLITLVFYLFVSTMTCIYELKQHGYLQILFRKGLGVLAYWAAIWTITLFEMALFAGVITTAYLVQCISFFSSTQLVDTFVGALLQFCLVAATVLLFSIVTKQLALSGAYCCTYLIIVVAIVLANRMYLAEGPIFVRYILLIMPAGHLAEQLFTSLTNISDNKVDSLMMHVSGGFLALTILFTVYFDFVFKSGNGWRLPCTFYFTSGFWSRPKKQPQEDDKEASAMFEAAQNWWRVLVATKGIKKSFASCMTKNEDALSNFSTKFYQDQITAVVGHNGSGKSILMQILSGERNATAGLATVDKVPITDSLTRYHMCSSIGYCPQHDGLVDRLSVSDTIKLAVLSTGKSWDREENKVRHILSSLGIESKIEESIQNLSYSEKRKVSVTIALIGQPRVVLLDDPSRDMDYISKRRLWQLLHEFKIGHSVIVSTLFINEAEAVADRIVFLSGGRVLCAGSPFFFKRAFDCRFIIQIASKTEFHVPYIIRKITSKFNSVRVRSFSNADVEFEVSVMDDSILSPVTAEIEKLAKLIDEYGIVHHSLDDVFSKLKSIPPKEVDRHFEMGTIGYVADDVDRIKALMKKKPVDPPDTPGKVKRMPSLLRTIFAMLVSSVLQTFRSKVRIVTRIAMPLFLVALIALGAFLERGKKNDNISLWVNLSDTSQVEESTRRGICMYPLSENVANHFDALNKKDCSSMLTSDALSENVVPMELLIEKYPRGNLQAALLAPKNLKKIKDTCKNSKVVCPIIFGNDFCPDRKPIPTYTKNHTISVGAYIPTSNYTPTYFVATAIKVYGHLLNVMIKKIYKDSSMDTKMLIVVEGIQDMRGTFFQFYGLFVLVTFISVVPVIFLDDVIHDKKSGVRHQLMSMGLPLWSYWFCKIIAHWIPLIALYLISIVPLLALLSSGYATSLFLLAIMPLTLVFGLVNSLLAAYSVSTLVKEVRYVIITFYALFSLLVALSVVLVQSNDLMGELFIFLFPQFAAIAPSFYGMRFAYYSLSYFWSMEQLPVPSLLNFFFSVPHLRDSIIALPVHFILLVLLLVLLENRHRCCKKGEAVTEPRVYEHCRETAIRKEIENVINVPKSQQHLMQVSVLKAINADGAVALRNLTFGLKSGEVFGLIGPCGSGKTPAMRAIAGDEKQKCAGNVDIQVNDKWLPSVTAAHQGYIGYCPRTDPLYHRLSVGENLNFYARVIGVSAGRVQQLEKELFQEQELITRVEQANAGLKRRLTLAIAQLADPPLMAIDEISSGIDHDGRQLLWNNIKSMVSKRRGIVLATQCVEEAEFLCDRMCIMNHGLMIALSSVNDLILRYKTMYFLEMQIASNTKETHEALQRRKDQLAAIVLDKFYGAILIEQWTARMQFALPIQSIGCLSNTLDWLYSSKCKLNIHYFTLHYATIDQVMKAIVVHSGYQMIKSLESQTEVSV